MVFGLKLGIVGRLFQLDSIVFNEIQWYSIGLGILLGFESLEKNVKKKRKSTSSDAKEFSMRKAIRSKITQEKICQRNVAECFTKSGI